MQTDDLRIRTTHPLISPAVLEEDLPDSEANARFVADARQTVARILDGRDQRLLVVVGPCSIHDPLAAVAYAELLKPLAVEVAAHLYCVMRVYFEKPRTVVGWKGLINDPDLDGSFRINKGLRLARRLLLDIADLELPAGTEFLDTTFGQYYTDLVSWGAIGARTVESQIHRELASGLSMPVGLKNRTDGDVQVAVDAIRAAAHPHLFPSLTERGRAGHPRNPRQSGLPSGAARRHTAQLRPRVDRPRPVTARTRQPAPDCHGRLQSRQQRQEPAAAAACGRGRGGTAGGGKSGHPRSDDRKPSGGRTPGHSASSTSAPSPMVRASRTPAWTSRRPVPCCWSWRIRWRVRTGARARTIGCQTS